MSGKTFRVEVTAEDIAKGTPLPEHCPVARALSRAFDTEIRVTRAKRDGHWVGVAEMVAVGGNVIRWRLSRAVGAFTLSFDSGETVYPFSFRVVR
jgi:hypothetical protein